MVSCIHFCYKYIYVSFFPNQTLDYSLDIWSFGVMFAALIFKKDTFFRGRDNYDQLVKIAKVLGTDELFAYVQKYQIVLDRQYDNILGQYPKRDWYSFVNRDNRSLANDEAIDLLNRLLRYDHQVSYRT